MRRKEIEEEMLAQPVRSLQYMLCQLSKLNHKLPKLEVDGNFGEETLETVMLFQREFHPPVTGIVDRLTWEAIRDRWLEAEQKLAEPRAVRIFPGEGSYVEPGANKEFMIVPQTMFLVLSRYFNGILPHAADGLHGPQSVENMRWLQKAAGLETTGVMDVLSWGMLSRLYELFVAKDLEDVPKQHCDGWG